MFRRLCSWSLLIIWGPWPLSVFRLLHAKTSFTKCHQRYLNINPLNDVLLQGLCFVFLLSSAIFAYFTYFLRHHLSNRSLLESRRKPTLQSHWWKVYNKFVLSLDAPELLALPVLLFVSVDTFVNKPEQPFSYLAHSFAAQICICPFVSVVLELL